MLTSNHLIVLVSKIGNIDIYKDRCATKTVKVVNKIYMYMFFHLTYLCHVYMSKDINLL